MPNKPSYAVIVGRFQVHQLHEGHLELFRVVQTLHHRVIVFLGCTRLGPTRRNPLDFETRRLMIQTDFPAFTILPLQDQKTDEAWSKELDRGIADVVTIGSATLYGSRDSFAPHYSGKHPVKELELVVPPAVSGTLSREQISDRVVASADFRAGCMYTMGQQFVRCFPTVDVAVFHYPQGTPDPLTAMLLLGRKSGETHWRFIGGFADAEDETYEATGVREVLEEGHGLHVTNLKYICSQKIDDWRYRQEPDKIKTTLFIGDSMTMEGRASDDLEEVKWFGFGDLSQQDFEPEHGILFSKLLEYLPATWAAGSGNSPARERK